MARFLKFKVALAFLAIYIIWGSTYLAILFGIESIPPFLMAGTRHLVAGLVLLFILRKQLSGIWNPVYWRSALVIGALMLAGGNGGVTWAEQRVPSGIAAVLVATVPMWMMVISWFQRDHDRPGVMEFVGMILGLIGITVLVGPEELLGGKPVDHLGALALFGAALVWAFGSLYSRKATLPSSAFVSAAMQMVAGGAVLIVLGLAAGERIHADAVTAKSAGALLYLVLLGSLVGYTAYIWLLKVSTPAKVSTYAYVNPLVAVFFGWLFAAEPISLRTVLAVGLIVSGVAIITLRKMVVANIRRWRVPSTAKDIAIIESERIS